MEQTDVMEDREARADRALNAYRERRRRRRGEDTWFGSAACMVETAAPAEETAQRRTEVLDEAAASLLARRDYYNEVERAQVLLETGKLRELGIGAR